MISIIIPVHNDPHNLEKCLESVVRSDFQNYECIVVDDGSTDETIDVARQFSVKVVPAGANLGPAHARNLGATLAQGDILFFIDADVLVYSDTLTKIYDIFKNHPDIDAVIGSYDDEPAEKKFISQYKNLFHHYVHQQARERACTFWSGCGAIKKKVFEAEGGFNENYEQPAIEDIELGGRLIHKGKNIRLRKDLQVKHLKHWTFWGLLRTDIFARGVPWTVIMLQNKNLPNDLNVTFSQRISVVLTYLLLATVIAGIFYHFLLSLAPILLVAIIMINLRFYRFYKQKRGLLFSLKVIPLHLLYYFYSGLSFVLGVLLFYKNKSTAENSQNSQRTKFAAKTSLN